MARLLLLERMMRSEIAKGLDNEETKKQKPTKQVLAATQNKRSVLGLSKESGKRKSDLALAVPPTTIAADLTQKRSHATSECSKVKRLKSPEDKHQATPFKSVTSAAKRDPNSVAFDQTINQGWGATSLGTKHDPLTHVTPTDEHVSFSECPISNSAKTIRNEFSSYDVVCSGKSKFSIEEKNEGAISAQERMGCKEPSPLKVVSPLNLKSIFAEDASSPNLTRHGSRINFDVAQWEADSSSSHLGNVHQARWDTKFLELQRYRSIHGDTCVPKEYPKDRSLSAWVHNQRKQYKKLTEGKKSALIPARVQALNDIGFQWCVRDQSDWDRRVSELKDFKAKYGHCLVPQRFEENVSLGTWVNTQRKKYRNTQEGRTPDLSEHKIRELERIGFTWSAGPSHERVHWDNRLQELKDYVARHGDALVPKRFGGLGRWVREQRTQYRALQAGNTTTLTTERLEQLNRLGFVWSVRK